MAHTRSSEPYPRSPTLVNRAAQLSPLWSEPLVHHFVRRGPVLSSFVLAGIGLLPLAPHGRAQREGQNIGVQVAQTSVVSMADRGDDALIQEPAVATVFNGRVVDASGAPVAGAVVVTSAGGQAVSERDGSFRLQLARCPRGASVNVTAVSNISGRKAVSSVQVTPVASGTSQVGPMTLQVVAGCQPSWVPTFGGRPGTNGRIEAQAVFDDGSGPALYAGGYFNYAGSVAASHIAKWNGSSWSALGTGMTNGSNYAHVLALTVFDDGSGPALYAGGEFTTAGGLVANHLAKWNGSSWSALGTGMNNLVDALAVFDDGSGPALYAGGDFTTAGGLVANHLAKWNGSSWSALGTGMNNLVDALAVFDDGSGAALYAGGTFSSAGGVAARAVAKWNESSWSGLASAMDGYIAALAVFDDGSGPALYAGGLFATAGGNAANNIAKWNGSSWSALGSGVSDYAVRALTVFDDGSGPALYAGGYFNDAGSVAANNIAKWNGSSWSALGGGMNFEAYALTVFDDGSGRALYAGGDFTTAGGVAANHIAKWNGSSWSALGNGMNSPVTALTVFNDGTGAALYAGGYFPTASGVSATSIAKWNGSSWSTLGGGYGGPEVYTLTVFDDGSGPALYAGGEFTPAGGVAANSIAKWNGSIWSALGTGMTNGSSYADVLAVTEFDDGSGPALYAGGLFATAGGNAANNIAKWNGSSWSALGSGIGNAFSYHVSALTVFNDGSGPALYAGGQFTTAGGVAANCIAKWNGSSWSALGSGMTDTINPPSVTALTVFDDGNGPALYAGGYFTTAGGVAAHSIAKWNGSSWSALGSGVTGKVGALTVFNDGSASALYAGGQFTTAGGVAANYIAKWNGSIWSTMGSGMTDFVHDLTVFDDSSGPALFAGGWFSIALDSGDSYIAKWGCPFVSSGTTYCTAGTTSNGCVPTISGSGNASATAGSGFTISVTNVEGQRSGLLFYGINGPHAKPWGIAGTSFLCVTTPTQRMNALNSGGTSGACDGVLSDDWNAHITSHPGALGQPFVGGETVWAQGWFRDPPSAKTTGLSNGLVFAVAP